MVRSVTNTFITLLVVVSTVVTARLLALTSERLVAPRWLSNSDCEMPLAEKPMTLASPLPVMAHAVSIASRHAET